MENDLYSDIGLLLRRARLDKRQSFAEISQALHIRIRYLEALEEGALTELPGLAYTKGYLQAYAGYLGLDKAEILRRFEEIEEELGKRGFYFPQVFSKEKKPGPWAMWGGLGVALLAYICWALLQAPRDEISVVEHFPEKTVQKAEIQPEKHMQGACFQPEIIYYPPCYLAPEQGFTLISLASQPDEALPLAH